MANVAERKQKRSDSVRPFSEPGRLQRLHLDTTWLIGLWLCTAVVLVFWPVHRFDFVNYDDPDYVSANSHVQSGLSWENVRWAFTTGFASNWHPLTWLSHMLDWQLFGNNPGAQHLISLAIHAVNTILLFLVLKSMTGSHWRSALVAALFGLHPLRAESVAWISERKDVLSALFLLPTLEAYARYASLRRDSHTGSRNGAGWYFVALIGFGLGLMCKPMLVTVPFLLLLIDYWPLQRFSFERNSAARISWLMLEKAPFLVLTVISSLVTFLVQQKGGAVSTVLPLSDRVANALVSYVRYLGKTFCPINLSVLYPHPGHWPAWAAVGAGLTVAMLSAIAIFQCRRHRFVFVGWFWFLGGLIPVIGLVQVGIQSMADRYTYIPSIGLSIVLVWGMGEFVKRLPSALPSVATLGGAVLVVLAAACIHQVQFWRDSETLFKRAIDVTSNNYLAYNNLGFYFSGKDRLEEAKENYRKSITINPLYTDALNNLGFALAGERKYPEAISYYERALRVSPNQPEIRNNLGNALSETGNLNEAIVQYRRVLELKPDHADANNNLGIALAMQGKLDEALSHFRAAIRAKPNYASAHSNLGNALAAKHQISAAIAEYEECLRLSPKDPQAHNNLGNALFEAGRFSDAIEHYRQALQLNPNNPEAHFNLGIALLKDNQRSEASIHFQEALRLNPANAEARRQLDALAR